MRNIHIVPLVALLASACSTSTIVGPSPSPSPTPAPIVTPAPTPVPQPVVVLPTLLVGLHVTSYDQTNTHFVAVVFAAEVSEGPATYAFDFGDGTSTLFPGASPSTLHQYPLTGSWTVTVTARTADGRSATSTRLVTTPPCQTYPSEGCR